MDTTQIAPTAWRLLEQWNEMIYQSMDAIVQGSFRQSSSTVEAAQVSLAFEWSDLQFGVWRRRGGDAGDMWREFKFM
jgi:hypothetical protein